MKNRGFTVLELIVAVVVVTVLASFAMAGYQRYQDRVAMLVDESNQKILQAAVKLYAYDTHALPGSLSELRGEDVRRATALVMEGKRPYTILAFLGDQLGLFELAEAVPSVVALPGKYYNHDRNVLICPGDPTPPSGSDGNISYELGAGWEGSPLSALLEPANANDMDRPLIVEADDKQSRRVVYRHGRGTLTVQTTARGDQRRKPGRAAGEEEWMKRGSNRRGRP